MRVFITGGSGLTGPAIVSELLSAGHSVLGLARSDAAAARLEKLGATAHRGSLDDLESLRAGAAQADGVIHMAFGGDFSDPDSMMRRDRTAIETLGQVLVGSGKPFVSTSGTLVMRPGHEAHEEEAPDPQSIAAFRIPGEQACLAFAKQGVRSSNVRLAPTVHGPGDYGFVPMLVATARRTGVSAYIGSGDQRWPAVHRLDAAVLYRLALEKAPPGTALHGASENVTLRSIAEKIGQKLGLPVRSVTPADAAAHFGNPFMARVFATDSPASSARTQALLGWRPSHATLLEDLETGDYFDQRHFEQRYFEQH